MILAKSQGKSKSNAARAAAHSVAGAGPPAAVTGRLGWGWLGLGGGRFRYFGFGSTFLSVTLRVPSISGKREGGNGNLTTHAIRATAPGAIMVIRGRESFEFLFGFPAGFASIFVKRHGSLVVKGAIGPDLKVYRGPWAPAFGHFFPGLKPGIPFHTGRFGNHLPVTSLSRPLPSPSAAPG
jgi:hypothetical protein